MSKFDDHISKYLFFGAAWSFGIAFFTFVYGVAFALVPSSYRCFSSLSVALTSPSCAYTGWSILVFISSLSLGLILYLLLAWRSRP